jgi:hypothetical protein
LVTKYLALVAQRDAFITGDTTVILFYTNPKDERLVAYDRRSAAETLSILDQSQRPTLQFCPGPASIDTRNLNVLIYKMALHPLEHGVPLAVPLETQWRLNAKETLARPGLPTPKCKIVELDGYNHIPHLLCCPTCQTTIDAEYYTPPTCTGLRNEWLNAQSNSFIKTITEHPLPFVLKNQQSLGGAGVFLIRTDEDRANVLKQFHEKDVFRKLFSQVKAFNAHLKPGTMLLSDLVKDPVSDTGLTLFVTDTGRCIFLGACEQVIEQGSHWTGNTINYRDQERLNVKFEDLMHRIADFVHKEGYFGPVGADVLETRTSATDGNDGFGSTEDTAFQIVDLNVRTSGSMALPLLRTHFSANRGLHCAGSFCMTVKNSIRECFIEKWKVCLASGQMVLLSWYEDWESGISYADGVVGAEDRDMLEKMLWRVKEGTGGVSF